MRNSILFALLLSFFFMGCDEDKYDDDQYGDHCLVQDVSGTNGGSTTTMEYDQYDRIISMNSTLQNQSMRMEISYNNDIAFADYFVDNQLANTSEATLDAQGNLTDVLMFDAQGVEVGELHFIYNADHHITNMSGYDVTTHMNNTTTVTWINDNPVSFTSPNGNVVCEYYVGEKSSINYGVGNTILLFQPFIGNVAMLYSADLIKVFDKNNVMSEANSFTYEKDSDDKVREMYVRIASVSSTFTTIYNYQCHAPH